MLVQQSKITFPFVNFHQTTRRRDTEKSRRPFGKNLRGVSHPQSRTFLPKGIVGTDHVAGLVARDLSHPRVPAEVIGKKSARLTHAAVRTLQRV